MVFNDDTLQKIEADADVLDSFQTKYILKKHERKIKLQQASVRVRKESMKINAEFSEIEYGQKT